MFQVLSHSRNSSLSDSEISITFCKVAAREGREDKEQIGASHMKSSQ